MYWVTYTVVRRSTIPILFGCKLTPATCSEAAFYSKATDKLSRIVTFLLALRLQEGLGFVRQRQVLLGLHFLETRKCTLKLKRKLAIAIKLINRCFCGH